MFPIIFRLKGIGKAGGPHIGRLTAESFVITGQTTDSTGATPVPGCTVHLFRTEDDVEIDMVVSDVGGNFEFRGCGSARAHYCVSYLPGSPDKAGTTLNTLVGA